MRYEKLIELGLVQQCHCCKARECLKKLREEMVAMRPHVARLVDTGNGEYVQQSRLFLDCEQCGSSGYIFTTDGLDLFVLLDRQSSLCKAEQNGEKTHDVPF